MPSLTLTPFCLVLHKGCHYEAFLQLLGLLTAHNMAGVKVTRLTHSGTSSGKPKQKHNNLQHQTCLIQISSCLTLLLHTKYMSAVHQAAIGSAHMVCSDKTLKVLLHDASQSSLPAHADFTKVLVDSCSTEGPCPSIVIGDNLHFRNICINAKTSTIDFVDPFGHGFPTEIRQLVQDFYDMHAGKSRWTYRTWSHIMQTDNYNCGIWSIWVMEKWMQYWSQDSISTTFENYCKRHAALWLVANVHILGVRAPK